jgi:beta-glucosidase
MYSDYLNPYLLLLHKYDFGDNFLWGLSSNDEPIKKNDDIFFLDKKHQLSESDASCYMSELDKYKQNIALIKELGISNFKFSLSWSKILPDGTGDVNSKAIDFYHEILDICIANDIEPFVTLFDSYLPISLELHGGWSNREIIKCFENYVAICANAFKDKVKYWIVIKEPAFFTGAGHFLGIHSSAKKGVVHFLPALHHVLLCQSVGFKTIKRITSNSQVGTFFSCQYIISKSYNEKDIKAAERIDALLNRSFIEPLLGMGYPIKSLPFLKSIAKYTDIGDADLIKVHFDFIGLQNCTKEIVSHDSSVPYLNAKLINLDKINLKKAHFNFQIYHELMYLIIQKYSKYEGVKKIFIVENLSLSSEAVNLDAAIGIPKTNHLESFLSQMFNAKRSGGKINGFFYSRLSENQTH